jgi:hypothetical protein
MIMIEEREYDFMFIIEVDLSVNQVMRNGRVLNIAVLPRPAMYIPGVSILGAISGMMSDNASVGGSYYFQQHNGPFFNDTAKGGKSRPLRQVGMPLAKGNRQWAQRQLAGSASNSKGAVAMQAAIERTGISPDRNPQDPKVDQSSAPPVFTGGPALTHLGQGTNEVENNE